MPGRFFWDSDRAKPDRGPTVDGTVMRAIAPLLSAGSDLVTILMREE